MEIPKGLVADTEEHAIEVLSTCFVKDAFQHYLVYDHLELPDSLPFDVSINKRAFSEFIPDIAGSGASLVTLPGSAITSVWQLEDFTENEEEEEHMPRVLAELDHAAHNARKRLISAPRKVVHLLLIANDRASVSGNERVPSIADVMRPMLAMASERGWPVCLEATSARSRDVYKYLGFEVIEEMRIGAGRVDGDGHRLEDGPGIAIWAMVYGL